MNTRTRTYNVVENVGIHKTLFANNFKISSKRLIDKFPSLVEKILECVLGMHVGAAVGYIIGKIIGMSYVRYVSPVPFNEAEIWWMVPFIYGIYGAVLGAVLGLIIIIAVITSQYIKQARSCKDATGGTEKVITSRALFGQINPQRFRI